MPVCVCVCLCVRDALVRPPVASGEAALRRPARGKSIGRCRRGCGRGGGRGRGRGRGSALISSSPCVSRRPVGMGGSVVVWWCGGVMVCVCVCACVRECGCVCVYACASAAFFHYAVSAVECTPTLH